MSTSPVPSAGYRPSLLRGVGAPGLKAVCVGLLLAAGGAVASGRPSPPSPVPERPALQHTARDSAPPEQPLEVSGMLTHGARFAQLLLRFRGPGGSYQEVHMEEAHGWAQGAVPASAMTPPGVEYYVEGVTARGERVPLYRSADRPARVLVLRRAPQAPAPPLEQGRVAAPPAPAGVTTPTGARAAPQKPAAQGTAPHGSPKPPPADTPR